MDSSDNPDFYDVDEEGEGEPKGFPEEFWDGLGTDGKPLQLDQIANLAIQRPITVDDIRYLLSQYRYLDICNADVSQVPGDEAPVKIIVAKSGWMIHDRGDRITVGVGRLLYGGYKPSVEDDDEESGGGTVIKPVGTLVQQAYDTVIELISMAQLRSWPSAEILAGHSSMQRHAWFAAKTLGFPLNYSPTAYDQQSYELLSKYVSTGLMGMKFKANK